MGFRLFSLAMVWVLGGLLSSKALADSRSSLVFVSVRVVDSCRVSASSNLATNGVDVNMRCTSAARPSVRWESQGPLVAGAESAGLTGSQPVSSLSMAQTGDHILRIDF